MQELSRIIGASCHSLLNGLDDDAVREITANSGLSRVMVREVVRGMGASWSAEAIARMVAAEFPDPGVLDGFVADGSTDPPPRSITATAPALTLLIGSGAVPGVTVTAMIRALVVKSAVLAKPGAGDTALTTRFTRELFRTDPRVGAAAAVRCWPGGRGGVGRLGAGALRRSRPGRHLRQRPHHRVRSRTHPPPRPA